MVALMDCKKLDELLALYRECRGSSIEMVRSVDARVSVYISKYGASPEQLKKLSFASVYMGREAVKGVVNTPIDRINHHN